MENLTPMMLQYKKIKESHADCILMFRLGDFYEMFFEDALTASKILQITLTGRNKGGSEKAPMCGVPFHAVDNYISKLTRVGKKVAICDQMTAPNGKTIVERQVIRVITPGTTFDENVIDNKANNYVSCIVGGGGKFGFAYCDVTTGEFKTTEISSLKELRSELAKVNPAECICSEELRQELKNFLAEIRGMYTFPYSYFKESSEELRKNFEIKSLAVFGLDTRELAVQASGMLFEYLKETQKTDLIHIRKINYYEISEFMPLDESVVRNLELFYTGRDGKKDGSLNWVLDQTVNSMGGRMLRNWLLHPLLNGSAICDRLNKVEIFVGNSSLLRNVRDSLSMIYDIERLLSRLSLGSGNARDLIGIKKSLEIIPEIKNLIKEIAVFEEMNGDLELLEPLKELIEKAIADEPPMSVRDGGMIKHGFNQELDELKSISTEGKTFIKDMQEREIARTGINSLKIKFNSVFGYYIEISKANLKSVPDDYIRKQTLVNAERFITPELKEYEDKVLNAEERIKALEYELFYQVRMEVVKEIVRLQKIAKRIAELDVYGNFAYIAVKNNYCKPEILDNGNMNIVNGRHPVIEQLSLARDFVPNDCKLDEMKKFLLITGPNMGGKSTFLRQVALIVLMAQIGSYVSAEKASISVCDRIFTRVGASDNLTRGESTFMVEMQEASYILNNATEKSLIILDEIGRGTSTYDGVSIAWAIMEFIHDKIGAKTIFATHYHELIELADKLDKAANFSVTVRENEKEGVVFLYKIVEGGVDKSYGIEVAKLAGLPVEVTSRARGVLTELETKHIQKTRVHKDQIELFDDSRAHQALNKAEKAVLQEIKDIDVNSMTPLQAMQKLEDIKQKSLFNPEE
ncbi:MAG: DNA mismatch repair protein MutS [Candidatus Gracilibacteria bacterium]|jgi:DNA mismatch repair protein MutS